MKTRTFFSLFIAIFVFLMPSAAVAGCTLQEVIKMANGGSGKKVIEEQCDSEVDDMTRCNFSRVITLALNKKSVYSIKEECGPCDNPECDTFNGSCGLGRSAPKGIKPGAACYCNTFNGAVSGEVSCNN